MRWIYILYGYTIHSGISFKVESCLSWYIGETNRWTQYFITLLMVPQIKELTFCTNEPGFFYGNTATNWKKNLQCSNWDIYGWWQYFKEPSPLGCMLCRAVPVLFVWYSSFCQICPRIRKLCVSVKNVTVLI